MIPTDPKIHGVVFFFALFAKVITTATATILQKDPDIALDTAGSALESNYAPSAMAAALPAVGEGLCYVAAGTTLAAGTAVVGSVCVGGVIYYLVAESAVNPGIHRALVDDGESDYDKIMAMEAARKLHAEQQAMLSATGAKATAATAAFMGQPRGPSIFSTPLPPLFDPRLVTPIAATGATFLTTPVATLPTWQESVPIWTAPPVQLVTPIPDVPAVSVLFNKSEGAINRTCAINGFQARAGDQPWVIRPGQEYKSKIFGRAQKTGTEGHRFRSYREAVDLARRDEIDIVTLNRGMNRFLDVDEMIFPNTRPDVCARTVDGKLHQVEVPSKSDRPAHLEERMMGARDKLPKHKQGEFENKYIKKGNK